MRLISWGQLLRYNKSPIAVLLLANCNKLIWWEIMFFGYPPEFVSFLGVSDLTDVAGRVYFFASAPEEDKAHCIFGVHI